MKILAQESSSLDKMIREAALAAPDLVPGCLERLDAALFFELGKETFGGGRRFEAVRLDRRTVATTVGVVSFKRRHYIDRALGRRCHPLDRLHHHSRVFKIVGPSYRTKDVLADLPPREPHGAEGKEGGNIN